MKTKFKFKDLTPKQAIAVAIIVAVIVAVVWLLWGKIASFFRDVRTKTIDKNDSENATGTNVTPTIDFTGLCDQLYNAGPRRYGTDEVAIYNVLGVLKTPADYHYLCRCWASYWKGLGWMARHNDTSFGFGNSTLSGMLSNELTQSELQNCRDILTRKGITPDF